MEKTKLNDFIELEFTGAANGEVFDTNNVEQLKKLNPDAKPQKLVLAIGQRMVVIGLDEALVDKETTKEYHVKVPSSKAFGPRNKSFVKTIPLSVFESQKVYPRQGMTLLLDQNLVKIIAVSGARVLVDFNNPLAGKDLEYNFKILRIVSDTKEKATAFFEFFFRFVPEFEINEKVTIIGSKEFESIISIFSEKFKELVGCELSLKIKEPTKEAEAPQP